MARRGRASRRDIPADGKYYSKSLQMFINKVMIDGKKSTAEGLVYNAMERMEETAHRPAIDIFDQALRNATPAIERPRRARAERTSQRIARDWRRSARMSTGTW